MFKNMSKEELLARTEQRQKEGFEGFLNDPLAKMIIADIPGEDTDKLRLLLKAAYQSGYTAGRVETMIDVVEAIFSKDQKQS